MSKYPHVCIVEASAGTGKTYALASRYLQLMADQSTGSSWLPFKNILAITFSNKATIEMKERIFDLLKKIALDQFSDQEEKKQLLALLGLKEAEARRRALALTDGLIRSYNFFQVQTIDSFVNAILSGCAFKLGLSANFRIRTDSKEYLTRALDKLLDQAATDKETARLFRDLLDQYLYLERKSGWFPREDIFKILTGLFNTVHRLGRDFMRLPAEGRDLVQKKNEILKKMRHLAEELPGPTHKSFSKSLTQWIETDPISFDFGALSAYFSREEFPMTKGVAPPRKVARLWEDIHRELRETATLESSLLFNAYIDIFHRVSGVLRDLAGRDDVLFLDELNYRARLLFDRENMTVPELYYRLAMGLKHFLVDEFQDTSRLQWQNLDLMVEEALSVRGSLFYVGDKKQAVYRFRGGDVTLFDGLRERFSATPIIDFFLSRNFRSRKEIVEFNNLIFSQENLNRFLISCVVDREAVLKVYEGAKQEALPRKDGGYVRLEFVDALNKDERDTLMKQKVLSLLDRLFQEQAFGFKDVAILVRENRDVELVSEWLIERHLPVASEKTLDIRANPRIKELSSFLKFLHSPIDNLAFSSFLFGDIFTRASGIPREDLHDFVFHLRPATKTRTQVYFYRAFREKFPGVWDEFFDEFFKSVGFIPLYELTIGILAKFHCLEVFTQDQGFFMRFLELIQEQEEERASLSLFLEFFEEGSGEDFYLKGAATEAVRVMTIHKAKGLGFPVVILPFLEMAPEVDPVVTCVGEEGLLLRRMSEKYRKVAPVLEDVYSQEYRRAFIDELNGVYVALTRASDALFVFVPQNPKRFSNLLTALFPEGVREAGRLRGPEKQEEKEETGIRELGPSHYEAWGRLLKEEFLDRGILERRHQIEKGEMVHYGLSFLGNLSGLEKKKAAQEVFAGMAKRYLDAEEVRAAEGTIRKVLETRSLEPFFAVPDGTVFCEKEVADASGRVRRLDRLIVKENEAWIVDYKSTREEERFSLAQLRGYRDLVGALYPSKKVRCFFIFLDELKAEEVA